MSLLDPYRDTKNDAGNSHGYSTKDHPPGFYNIDSAFIVVMPVKATECVTQRTKNNGFDAVQLYSIVCTCLVAGIVHKNRTTVIYKVLLLVATICYYTLIPETTTRTYETLKNR